MKKAIQIAYNERFEYECKCAAEAGFRHIAINYTEITGKNENEWNLITDNIILILEKYGLKCVQSHPHYYSPLQSSEIIDEDMEFAIRQSIISSAKVGARYCVIHPKSAISDAYITSKSLEANKAWFTELLECAVKYGTGIAAENLPIFPSVRQIDPFFSSNPEELSMLSDYFNDEHFGICWDFGHANLLSGDQSVSISYLGKKIKCTHVHNNWGERDDHAPPLYGNIPWDRVMKSLANVGYNGPLTLETHCWYDDNDMIRSFYKHNFDSIVYLESLAKSESI